MDDQIILMQKLVLDKHLSKRDKGNLFFALGKCFEELKDFRSSYEYYSQGNFLIKKVLKYNFQQDSNLFEQVKTNFIALKESNINVISKSNHVAPIFIVGMPRSGTTLVEQIISSNSKIFGGGELPFITEFCSDFNFKFKNLNENILIGFRSNYLNKLKNISKGENIITDKMPQNFLYIGIIAMIFPEAKIINVKRHPAAACWSNYKQFFVSKSMGYSYDLEDLVKYYYNYIHLMNFWETQFPNKIYNLNYDLLTENKEFETKKLFDYLDIDFETSSLSPHKNKRIVSTASNLQVRNEVYKNSSVEWKKFKPFLKGILDKLDHL